MKLKFIFLLCCFFAVSYTVNSQDKVHVKTHNKDLATTRVNDYKKWGVFPAKDESVRKIIMKVTMGTPVQDTMRCADWDYSDPIYISKVGGVNGTDLNYEIGRMLTPYGGANPKGWEFQWEIDVTDFASLLRDSVEINYTHQGGEPGHDRGWAITVDFEITKGTPILEPIKINEVYKDSYVYGNIKDDIENHLKPYTFKVSPQTGIVRSRILQTGHGMDRPDNCGEFCSKWRDMIWNGKVVETTQLWKNCSDNALYPQAGTWLIDRANWCPGDLIEPQIANFNVRRNSSNTYDLAMEPYVSKGRAIQQISAYLIEYKACKNSRDVEVYDIVAPTNKQFWGRYNPTSTNPIIIVRNNTSKAVKSLELVYGVEGKESNKETWKGVIKPFSKVQIELSNPVDNQGNAGVFKATVTKVNGSTDQYTADNTLTTSFDAAPKHKGDFVVVFEPNKTSDKENYYYIVDKHGNKVFEKKLGDITDINKDYTDKITLEAGDYEFRFFDTAGDGLEFWYNRKSGNGQIYILNSTGGLVKYFNPDFGDDIRYAFTVDNALANDMLDKQLSFWLSETATDGKFQINLITNNKTDKINVQVVDYDSKIESSFTILPPADGVINMDISTYPTGRHFVIIEQNGYKYLRRVWRTDAVKVKE